MQTGLSGVDEYSLHAGHPGFANVLLNNVCITHNKDSQIPTHAMKTQDVT